ncbi:Tripartite ATP-independent periplasmic transporter DctQ component [uncultured Desulfatiglans sp.]|uniref:Tripartite ATP-independent periplasmic transporter DctQ component n=1 Tax=Uncultured Desulfatiglans sp. TaxID=1748965 RepID=A0A653A956_UNCDX|nr:Tripartite ATP-independent periplasmic transporter DctQ component [uncultured Desulfatiglans sp.]
MSFLSRILEWLVDKLNALGAITLTGMMLMTCVDVVGRFFGHPVLGSVEIVGFLATLTVALALPYTHRMDGHIGVELFIRSVSPRIQAVVRLCTTLLALGLFAIVTWRMADYAQVMKASGQVSMNLRFPEYTIIYLVALAFLILTLVLIQDIVRCVNELRGES